MCASSVSYYIVVLVFCLLSVCFFVSMSFSLSGFFLVVCPFSCLSFCPSFYSIDGKLNFPKIVKHYQTALVSSCFFSLLNRPCPWRKSNLVFLEGNFVAFLTHRPTQLHVKMYNKNVSLSICSGHFLGPWE